MKKVLVICGPTATGKTDLAIHLIKSLSLGKKGNVGEIISVDSRQVYRQMDIGTGKDLPVRAKFIFPDDSLKKKGIGCYVVEGVRIWGYDLVSPDKDFSVGDYLRKAIPIVKSILRRKKIPVLVGGSGLYLKALVDGIQTAFIPRDNNLREFLSSFSTEELFEKLAQLDSQKAASLNLSDRKNPRRLIRAIEIAQWQMKNFGKNLSPKLPWSKETQFLFIGLFAPLSFLKQKIKKRVYKRIVMDFEEEVKTLIKAGISWSFHSMDTLGYKNIKRYIDGEIKKSQMIKSWINDEFSYAKRQMTWFKKDKRIIWFDSSLANYKKEVEKFVKDWYYNDINL